MVYCAAFDYNANSNKNRAKCSWFKFPTEPTLSKTSKLQTDEAQPALLAPKKTVSIAIQTREGAALGYPAAKISLKQDVVPTLFPVVEAMLMTAIRRTKAATRALMTPVQFGYRRFRRTVNSDSILWRLRHTTLVTSASERSDLGQNGCVPSTWNLMCVLL